MSGVLFYVQHLLGVGHVKRAASIVRACRRHNLPITVVMGGEPVSHADFGGAEIRYLPSARAADENFKILLDEMGQPIDDKWRDARRDQLLRIAAEINPDVLFVELYPFGRRQFRFELIPLMEAFKGRAKIICSARDVIVGKARAKRNDEIVETLNTYFDGILVHGVEDVIPLRATFPAADKISKLLSYTGYVIEETQSSGSSDVGAGEIVISVGGGAVGEDLFRGIVAARPLSVNRDKRWRMIAGSSLADGVYNDIEMQCGEGLSIERARDDFIYVLRNCALSISLGGYNTVMDVMSAGCSNLIVPFSGGVETEQLFRAEAFAKHGWINLFDGDVKDPNALAGAIDAAIQKQAFSGDGLDINGADTTARLISGML